MEVRPYRTAVFALYQVSLLLAIAMLPVAVAARRFGVTLPVHRAVDRLRAAYERSQADSE